MSKAKSLYRSCAGSNSYGTEYDIWADFGLVGNNEKRFGADYEQFLRVFFSCFHGQNKIFVFINFLIFKKSSLNFFWLKIGQLFTINCVLLYQRHKWLCLCAPIFLTYFWRSRQCSVTSMRDFYIMTLVKSWRILEEFPLTSKLFKNSNQKIPKEIHHRSIFQLYIVLQEFLQNSGRKSSRLFLITLPRKNLLCPISWGA